MTMTKLEECARAIGRVETGMGDAYLDELIHAPWQKSWEQPVKPRWEQWLDAALAVLNTLRNADVEMKMAGATAITAEHMKAMANYDAADDCWNAMIDHVSRGGE